MDECNKIEQQQQQYVQNRQTIMKKEKKNENRLKSKLTTNALEKARAFFRALDFKHRHRHEQPLTDLPSSHEVNQKKEILLNPIPPTTTISTTRISRVEKINPRDMIVHRIIPNDNKLPLNYFQQKYKQYLKPSLLIPKQYYNEILNKRYQTYSNRFTRHDLYSQSPISTLSPNLTYSTRPIVYHEIESSSMLTWNQCVRRLNTEYRLTIEALQQAKECLEQICLNSKSKCENKTLVNNETKKSFNVTFCLPPISNRIEETKIFKPTFVKPVELNTFLPPELSINENEEEKLDSIATIIQKFNELNNKQTVFDSKETLNQSKDSSQEEETTYTVETIYKNDLPSLNNDKIVIIQENTTEEQFNLAHQPVLPTPLPSVIPKNKSISHIPVRIATSSKVKPSSSSSSTKIPSIRKQPSINKIESSVHVKSMVQQINASSRSTTINKRPSRPTSNNKNLVQRK